MEPTTNELEAHEDTTLPPEITYPYLRRWDNRDPATGSVNYMGGDYTEYFVGPCSINRDDYDAVTQTNWKYLCDELKKIAEEGEGVWMQGEFSHWACGWYKIVLIHESQAALLKRADEIAESKDGYPILDEDAESTLRYEQQQQEFDNDGRTWILDQLLEPFEFVGATEALMAEWYPSVSTEVVPDAQDATFDEWLFNIWCEYSEYGSQGHYLVDDLYDAIFTEELEAKFEAFLRSKNTFTETDKENA